MSENDRFKNCHIIHILQAIFRITKWTIFMLWEGLKYAVHRNKLYVSIFPCLASFQVLSPGARLGLDLVHSPFGLLLSHHECLMSTLNAGRLHQF